MSLSYALLSLLVDCPSSGYDLNKAFENSVGCFWKSSHQQIYRELSKLEGLGWVSVELIPQSGKPDKKQYRVTVKGQQALADWITQPADINPIKEEILIKLFVGHLVEPAVLKRQIEDHQQRHQDLLATYKLIEATSFPETSSRSQVEQCRYLTLRCGIQYAISRIDWCNEVLAYLATV